MHTGIKELFRIFEEGYIQRDTSEIHNYMEIFSGEDTMILGTSPGELCLGYDQCRKLIEEDWKDWADLRIDHDSITLQELGTVTWFTLRGTLKYTFGSSQETWERFVHFGRDAIRAADKGPEELLLLLNWALVNAVQPREPKERDQFWPLGLTGAIIRNKESFKFRYMQFFVPCGKYPDFRVGTPLLDFFNLKEHIPLPTPVIAVAELIPQVETVCALLSRGRFQELAQYFRGDSVIVGPRLQRYQGLELGDGFSQLRHQWGEFTPDLGHAVVQQHGTAAWVYCPGFIRSKLPREQRMVEEVNNVKDTLEGDSPPVDKLIQTQIDIASTIKELASGEEGMWPCRFELAFHQTNGWTPVAMTISLPFQWILEGRFRGQRASPTCSHRMY